MLLPGQSLAKAIDFEGDGALSSRADDDDRLEATRGQSRRGTTATATHDTPQASWCMDAPAGQYLVRPQ